MKNFSVEKLIQVGYRYVTKSQGRFYLYLAIFCSVLVVLDAGSFELIRGMKLKTFDVIMKNRVLFHKADPAIVIVDIDEASLEAMAQEYGRWPWPRQVFAEFLETLQDQQPSAVVFDILFSDPDVFNKESDSYFNDVVSDTGNTFFPMMRLASTNILIEMALFDSTRSIVITMDGVCLPFPQRWGKRWGGNYRMIQMCI